MRAKYHSLQVSTGQGKLDLTAAQIHNAIICESSPLELRTLITDDNPGIDMLKPPASMTVA